MGNTAYLLVLCVLVGIVIGFDLGGCTMKNAYQKELINRGYAQYNQTSGSWEWKDDRK